MSESLISIAPRVFKDRRVGSVARRREPKHYGQYGYFKDESIVLIYKTLCVTFTAVAGCEYDL